MSIYRLYIQNANCAGFWIQHRSWPNICARVLTIAGNRRGSLPGVAPTHLHADVVLQCYDVRSGRAVPTDPALESPQDHGFVMIAEPPWARRILSGLA